jgi:hypothetical protein
MLVSVLLLLPVLAAAQVDARGLRIVSPPDGTIVEPGQPFTVVVELDPGVTAVAVALVSPSILTFKQQPPFSFTVTFPADVPLGPQRVVANGVDTKERPLRAEMTLHIETATPVTSLRVGSSTVGWPPSVNLIAGVIEEHLRVDGVFTDGATRDISKSREIQYISSDPQVATVTADGLVEAVDPGTTTITVTYKGKSVTVPVTVKFKKLSVPIDIKPRGPRNIVHLTGKGRLPVAILSTPDFDVAVVRPETVRFGPGRAKAVPGGEDEREERKERGVTPRPQQVEDVNHDGRPDLLLHFKIRDTGLACADTQATLTGFTTLGQRIDGIGAIQVVGPGCH